MMRHARLNITWKGQNGDLPDPVSWHAADAEILRWAAEAVQSGSVPGIRTDRGARLHNFVVDRFPANKEVPEDRIYVRPPTPFGYGAGPQGHAGHAGQGRQAGQNRQGGRGPMVGRPMRNETEPCA